MRKHSGEVSFPGGVHERGDKDLIDTALRETKEELGLVNDQSLNNKLLPISRYHEILSSSHIVGKLQQKSKISIQFHKLI